MVECNRVSKHYGAARGIQDITFSIPQGGLYGLLGPNGAGKTTLMKVLTGFHRPEAGQVRIHSYDPVNQPVQVKSAIGYLPEHAPLYTEMIVKDYLLFTVRARNVAGSESKAIEKAAKAVNIVDVLNRPIANLSKGYRQRVGLAQAIIHDPPLLILDEPTTGLDPNQIQEIRSLILELSQEKTVIFSSHILHEVETLCKSVLVLHEGNLVANGSLKEIATTLRGGTVVNLEFGSKNTLDPNALERYLIETHHQGWKVQAKEVTSGTEMDHTNRSYPPGTYYRWSILAPNSVSLDQSMEYISPWIWNNKLILFQVDTTGEHIEDLFAKLTKDGSR